MWEKNGAAQKAWEFSYDLGGNITQKTEYLYQNGQTTNPQVISYTYGDSEWHDLLTAWNGQPITYDVNDDTGNPVSYRGWTMTWVGGRQLAGMTDGTDTLSFAYNEKGLRTEKTVNNVTRKYIWNDKQLIADIGPADAFYFRYNSGGDMLGYRYKAGNTETECIFVKNQQGDVERILDAGTGTVLASYTYDAWGNTLTATGSLAAANPIRYRGYYFDTETGLYYIGSRYYDPEANRWISPDKKTDFGAGLVGYCLYAYCANNPVNSLDINGQYTFGIGIEISGGFGIRISYSYQIVCDDKWNIGILVTRGVGGGTPSSSGSIILSYTTADTIEDLNGYGGSIGGMGFDTILGTAQNGDPVYGVQLSIPLTDNGGIPEMHGEVVYAEIASYIRHMNTHSKKYRKKSHYPPNTMVPELF